MIERRPTPISSSKNVSCTPNVEAQPFVMKATSLFVTKLLLSVGVLFIIGVGQPAHAREDKSSSQANAIFATSAADGGQLIIKRSKTLGDNVSINLIIDGQYIGSLVRRRTYDRYLTPGHHTIVAEPSTWRGGRWRGTLDVHQGQIYTYVASYNVNRIILTRVANFR